MVTRVKKGSGGSGNSEARSSIQLASTVKESAQQIWLAGLGAFSKAQEEGGKVFEALVKDGLTLQRRTQAIAEERLAEASSRMTSMTSELSNRAAGQWDKLESIFEQRVSRALENLGVPTSKDVDALLARIEELDRTVATLRAGNAGTGKARTTAPTRKVAAKRPPAKAARKRSTARKAVD
jgi:poly(hydroxyalkanoate) granule-associated protein